MSHSQKVYLCKRSENQIFYYGVINDVGKKVWKSTGCKSKSDALSFVKALSASTEKKVETLQKILFSMYYESYKLSKSHNVRQSTLNLYKYSYDRFIELIGDKYLTQYTSDDIERFKRLLLDKGNSKNTINMYMKSIRTIFQYAVDRDVISKSPFKFVKDFTITNKNVSFLQKEDLEKLLEKIEHPELKDLYVIAVLTGMRLSELVNLKWSSINFEQQVIKVVSSDEFTTKTGKSRVVPMHQRVYDILIKRPKKYDYVFCKKGGFRYEKNYVSRVFKRGVIAANLNSDLHFHSTRHSCASLLANAGTSIFDIQKILGHSSVNVTANTYSHLLPSTLINSINRIQI